MKPHTKQRKKSVHNKAVAGRPGPRRSSPSPSSSLDQCARLVKSRVKVWPSARASQQVAKCRRKRGVSRKTAKGTSLRRWQREKWVDVFTGKPCGSSSRSLEYCRPTVRVSRDTPKLMKEMNPGLLKKKKSEKRRVGMGKRASPA